MSLRSEIRQFQSGVTNAANDTLSALRDKISGLVRSVSVTVGSILDGDVVGIHASEVDNMITQIEGSVTAIRTHLAEVNTETNPAVAFADEEMQEGCRVYIKGVMAACEAYTSQLLAFADLLYEVREQYRANEDERAANLRELGGDLHSNAQEYARKY
jgi:hypothetical protein